MDDDTRTDPLQPPDDLFNPVRDEEHLPGDYDPPAAPAPDSHQGTQLPSDHPEFDTDLEPEEVYDEGLLSATDIDAHEESSPPPDKPEPMEWDETK